MVARAVAEAVEALQLAGRRILVACSGGIDSTVLLAALDELAEEFDLKLAAGHVNHGLRGADSEADEAFVRELARERRLPFRVQHVEPARLREGLSSRERPTLQEAARRLRYRALEQMAEDLVATAHTLDDQVETVLLRLVRGSGPDGLGGIPEVRGNVVRPLLRVPRGAIEVWARRRGLAWREDASNASPAYARNRIRRFVRDLEAGFNPQLLRAIGDLAEAQRRDSAWIEQLVGREAGSRFAHHGDELVIDAKDWESLPEALRRRLAREALRRAGAGRDVSRVHLARVVRFLGRGRRGTSIEIPGGLVLAREGGSFRLRAKVRG